MYWCKKIDKYHVCSQLLPCSGHWCGSNIRGAFRDTQSTIQSNYSFWASKPVCSEAFNPVCGSAWQSVISAVQHASLMPLLLSFLGGDLGGKCYSCLYSYHDPHQVCHDNWYDGEYYGDCFFPVMILIRSLCWSWWWWLSWWRISWWHHHCHCYNTKDRNRNLDRQYHTRIVFMMIMSSHHHHYS